MVSMVDPGELYHVPTRKAGFTLGLDIPIQNRNSE